MGAGLPFGIVLAKNNVDLGYAFFLEVEGANFLRGHANVNFGQAGIILLLHKGRTVHRSGLLVP